MIRVTPDRRVYVGGYRFHHGLAGALLAVLSAALIWHDRRDFPWPVRDRTRP